jgi:hypothetical protein
MAWKSNLAVVGLLLIPIGIGIRYEVDQQASWQPPVPKDGFTSHVPKPTVPEYRPDCTVKVDPADKRKLTVNESFTLTVHVVNDTPLECKNEVRVFAAGFEVQPPSQPFTVPMKQQQDFKFTLMSKNPGSQVVEVSYNREEGYEQYELGYSIRSNSYLPAWMTPFFGVIVAVFGPMLTVPWWIDRREKKAKGTQSVAGQKRFGLLMESGQRLYNEIANLRGEDLEAWDARLIEWQTSIRTALEEINCPADYPEFVRAADESEHVAVAGDGKNLRWKQDNRRRKLQKQQQKLEEIVQRRLS